MELQDIFPSGDLLVEVVDENREESFIYKVDSTRLKTQSRYFEVLLSDRFNEGVRVRERHSELLKRYGTTSSIPSEELPKVTVLDIGRISEVKSIKNITADFFKILHDVEIAPSSPLPNLANLTIVADRFDSLETVSKYLKRRRFLQKLDAKAKGRPVPEERVRQKLLVGLLLEHTPWVTTYSKMLILQGSSGWSTEAENNTGAALWVDLPLGVEGTPVCV
jgi:hypothetical protein